MKKKELSLAGTSVVLEESKEKMASVHIQTEDADIYINGVLVWQKYDDPTFAKIPPAYRAFIKSRSDYIQAKEGKRYAVEVDCHDRDIKGVATFYFPHNLRSAITVRFDFITSLQEFEDDYIRNNTEIDDATADALVAEFKQLWAVLEEEINSYGWKFAYSHAMNEHCFGWWDVIFKNSHWNEEHLLSVWKKMGDFVKRVEEVMDQYHM